MKKLLTGTLIGTIMFFTATAQTSKADPKDAQGWYGLGVKLDLPKKWTAEFDYQTRFINNLSTYNGSYFSAGINRKLGKILEAGLEYRLALVQKGTYHRVSAGLEASKKWKPIELSWRLLVQNQLQDFVDPTEVNQNEGYWRSRWMVKYSLNKKWELFAATEPVMKFGGNNFVDNWRNTIGTKVKLAPRTKLELYYIYRPDYAKKTYNRFFHIFGLNLTQTLQVKKNKENK